MKSKLGILSLWILVFLLGGVAGAVSHYLYVRKDLKKVTVTPSPPKRRDIQEGLARVLDLDAQQKEELKTIFAKSLTQFRALNKEYGPKWEAVRKPFDEEVLRIRKEFDEEVKKTLRPDQRAKFEQFLKKVYSQPTTPRTAQPAK